MAESPYIKWFTSDFLTGVRTANLKADEIGVYTVILTLIADRGAPIEDDRPWIAGQAGTSTRRCNQIIARLIELGKLQVRHGMIGNPRMIQEVIKRDGKSQQARAAAMARWHNHDEPELNLPAAKAPSRADLSREKLGEHVDLKSGKNTRKPQKSASSDDADAFLTRAHARLQSPDTRSINDRPITEPAPPHAHAREAAFAAVCEAAGFTPSTDQQRSQAKAFLASWQRDGLDLEHDILPTIKRVVAESDDPTSSLKRFDRHMRHARAKAGASPPAELNGTPAPVRSIGRDDPEDERLSTIRSEIRTRIGSKLYGAWLKPVTLSIADQSLNIACPSPFHANHVRTEFDHRIRTIAKAHDLTTVSITADLTG